MNITQIPFSKHLEIVHTQEDESILVLKFRENMKNHIGTFHAGAQFALAESCSGLALQIQFHDLADSVVPVLRKAEAKFKKPASSNIRANASIDDEMANKFRQQLERKGRATISVSVEVADEEGTVTMEGTYLWFIHKL